MSSILIAILILVVVLTIISVVTTSSYLLTWKVVSQQNEKLIDSLSNISDKLKSSSISTDLEKSILILQVGIMSIIIIKF